MLVTVPIVFGPGNEGLGKLPRFIGLPPDRITCHWKQIASNHGVGMRWPLMLNGTGSAAVGYRNCVATSGNGIAENWQGSIRSHQAGKHLTRSTGRINKRWLGHQAVENTKSDRHGQQFSSKQMIVGGMFQNDTFPRDIKRQLNIQPLHREPAPRAGFWKCREGSSNLQKCKILCHAMIGSDGELSWLCQQTTAALNQRKNLVGRCNGELRTLAHEAPQLRQN